VFLTLNQTWFGPGDRYLLSAVYQSGEPAEFSAMLYIVLDPGFGQYWFWPSWAEYPPDIDGQPVKPRPGDRVEFTVLDFIWPTVDGSLADIRFWGALVHGSDTIIGELGMVQFSY